MSDMMMLLACLVLARLLAGGSCLRVVYVNSSSPLAVNDSSCWTGGALKPCLTFDLGLQGIHRNSRGELLVAGPGEYNLTNSNFTDFKQVNDLTIMGTVNSWHDSQKPEVVVKCSSGIGLSFTKASRIKISGIIFSGCGALRTSTSIGYNTHQDEPAFMLFHVSLYFLYCLDLNLTFIEVVDTPGTGVVIYNTIGNNVIHNSTFARNNFQPDSGYSGGGGLYIEFSFCDISTNECLISEISNVDYEYTHGSEFMITDSYFIDNSANISNSITKTESFILPFGPYNVAFGRGGGLSFYINGKANKNIIVIDNCVVADNRALWGGGILIEFHDEANNNSLEITRSIIQRNSLHYDKNHDQRTGGGGARLAMFMFAKYHSVISGNLVSFTNSTFEGNSAYAGGGVSFYATRTDINFPSNEFHFSSCNFYNNSARLGAGMDISLLDLTEYTGSPIVTLSSCEFCLNTAFYKNSHGQLVGMGTMYVEAIPVTFTGSSLFTGNSGSGLAVTGTHIEIRENSVLRFVNNSGSYGGALNLLGSAYIITFPNASLEFVKNKAQFSGGAIYYYRMGERDLVESGNCFIRYSDIFMPRKDWTSNFYFEGNLADGTSNAIYASTILPCIHNGIQWNASIETARAFCWNDRWVYKDENEPTKCLNEIKTAPSRYLINSSYQAVPGEEFSLNSTVYDDYGNNMNNTPVFLLRLINGSSNYSFERGQSVNYDLVSHGLVEVYGQPNSKVKVQIETINPVLMKNTFSLELEDCPPGFHVQESALLEGCVCAGNYSGYLKCNQETFTSKILRTMWMGSVPHHDELLVGGSPYISLISDLTHIPMPKNPHDLEHFFCGRTNAKGILCGSCIDGYGVSAIDLDFYSCVPCPESVAYYHWIFYLLACFLPILIFFGVVFIFNMTVTFGPLNSFIFFAQVINTVTKINADGMIQLQGAVKGVHEFYGAMYDMWNLIFFYSWLPQLCLSPSLNTLDILLLRYLQAVFPLVLLVSFFFIVYLYNKGTASVVFLFRPFHRCLARFRRSTNLRKSITGGIAAFILISYTQITLVSLLIVTPAYLFRADGTVADYVFYYNGDVPYRWSSVQYIIPAVIFLCTFVLIPPILLAYPTLLKAISCLSYRKLNVEKFYPNPKVQAFLDEFHGCYKDGSGGGIDCRWFSSLYFILRIILIAVYAACDTWELQYTVQILFFLSAAFLFVFIRPYRNDWINSVDTSMFLLLAAISTISFFNLMNTWIGKSMNNLAMVVQCVLVAIPLIYCICYCCVLIWNNAKPCLSARKKFSRKMQSKEVSRYLKQSSDCGDDLTDIAGSHDYSQPKPGLEDSTHVPEFLDFIESCGRSPSPCSTQSQPDPLQTWIPKNNTSINNSSVKDESSSLLSHESEDAVFPFSDSRSNREKKKQPKATNSSQPTVYGTT